jgi:serine/threonine-protein kinase HipA
MSNCLYCYLPLTDPAHQGFHESCSLEFFGQKKAPALEYNLDQMAELAKSVVERSIAIPGVQPKISLSQVKEAMASDRQERLIVVGALGGNYIFKPPSSSFPELPQNEHLTMRIAGAMGIRTVPCSLIRLASGELAYITRRIDRTPALDKIHMLDMFQVLEASDKYKSSMEKVGSAIKNYASNTGLDLLRYFELTILCFLTGNSDMHLKNFSLINTLEGEWELSPAYDLLNVRIAMPADNEELALTLNAKKSKFKRTDFDYLGARLELSERQIKTVYGRFSKAKSVVMDWLARSFLSEDMKHAYRSVVNERYARLQFDGAQ